MKAAEHPLYGDANLTRFVSQWHLQQGHTVLQLFQLGRSGERSHALELLRLTDPPQGARVLSLGCGIGGVEAYWRQARPDLSFELVNISQEQLDLCQCKGYKVCADAQGYASPNAPFDVVLLGYLLGHVDMHETLTAALDNCEPGGRIVIVDVFDVSARFRQVMCYDPPTFAAIEWWCAASLLRLRRVVEGGAELQLVPFIADAAPWVEREATPGLFVLEVPA